MAVTVPWLHPKSQKGSPGGGQAYTTAAMVNEVLRHRSSQGAEIPGTMLVIPPRQGEVKRVRG